MPLPAGGYEAESQHLRAAGGGRPSRRRSRSRRSTTASRATSGRSPTLPRGAGVAGGAGGRARHGPRADALAELRAWTPRLGAAAAAAIALGLALPLFQPLDNALFLAVNGLGDGPEWLYQALDPHTRNYILLLLTRWSRGPRPRPAALRRARRSAWSSAGYLAGAAFELIKLFVERARPEEVLGGRCCSHGRRWADLASYPSGHLIVTAAMTWRPPRVPALRGPLFAYVVMIALTRVTFGAHFPIDVVVGAVMGYELGVFATRLMASARLRACAEPEAAGHGPFRHLRFPMTKLGVFVVPVRGRSRAHHQSDRRRGPGRARSRASRSPLPARLPRHLDAARLRGCAAPSGSHCAGRDQPAARASRRCSPRPRPRSTAERGRVELGLGAERFW